MVILKVSSIDLFHNGGHNYYYFAYTQISLPSLVFEEKFYCFYTCCEVRKANLHAYKRITIRPAIYERGLFSKKKKQSNKNKSKQANKHSKWRKHRDKLTHNQTNTYIHKQTDWQTRKQTYRNSEKGGPADTGLLHCACCSRRYRVTIMSNVGGDGGRVVLGRSGRSR